MSRDEPHNPIDDGEPMDILSVDTIANNLIDMGTAFIAIPRDPLENGCLHLCAFAPGNYEIDEYARELETAERITVDSENFEFAGISNVLHSEVHFEDRIPIYANADSALGLPDIPLEEGLDNLHKFCTGDYNTQPQAETVSVETLIQELIEGGAVAISLEKNLVSVTGSPHLHFRAHMSPVTGHEIAGQYRTVTVGNKNYDFVVEPVLDGPDFFEKLPIYADEDIEGLDPVPLAWGIQNLQFHLESRLEEKLCNRYQFGDELHGYRVIEDLVEPIPSGWEVTVGAEDEDTGREVWVLNTVDYDAYQVAVFPPNSGEPLISLEYNEVETAFDIFEELLDTQAPASTSTDGQTMVPLTKEVREQLREKQRSLGTVLSQRLSNGGDTNNHATVNDTVRWVCSILDAQRSNNRCEQLNGRIRGYLTASFENTSDTEFSMEQWESLQEEPLIYALATAIHQWQIIKDEETGEQKLADLADPGDIAFAVFDNGYLFKGGQNPQLLYDPEKVSHIRKIVDERDETRERINEKVFLPDAGGNCALN